MSISNPSHLTNTRNASAPFKKYSAAQAKKSYTPEKFMKLGHKYVAQIKSHVEKINLGRKQRKEIWMKEIASLEKQSIPKTLIAVCGGTGVGKSSLLNAILDDNIVPTSGARACTSVATEVSYHEGENIMASVSFLSEKEWRDEVSTLLSDIRDEDGSFRRTAGPNSEAGIARLKVIAVYPELAHRNLSGITSVDEIIRLNPNITKRLGTVEKIDEKDSKCFAEKISMYIESHDSQNGPALWPLIKQVKVKCHAEALSTGAILVDLPGVADANAARNNVAKHYLKKCNCIWIVAPITRAVDDKTAKDLLGDAFKSQCFNKGFQDIEGKIAFVATKCDDVSCAEIIGSYGLHSDTSFQHKESSLKENEAEIRRWNGVKAEAENEIQRIEQQIQARQAGQVVVLMPSVEDEMVIDGDDSRPLKRRKTLLGEDAMPNESSYAGGGCVDGSDHEQLSPCQVLGSKVNELEQPDNFNIVVAEPNSAQADLDRARRRKDDASAKLLYLKERKDELQTEKNGMCSKIRSQYAREDLKNDFRAGLEDLDYAALENSKQDNSELPNPPAAEETVTDYSKVDLPVFTVSARDYLRIKEQVKGDGPPTCFTNFDETGIPDLQAWCHFVTAKSRERASRMFRRDIRVFAMTVQNYIESIGSFTEGDRERLRKQWQSPRRRQSPDSLDEGTDERNNREEERHGTGVEGNENGVSQKLRKVFSTLVQRNDDKMRNMFQQKLKSSCQTGVLDAVKQAVTTVDTFADSMRWQSYCAAIRRNGEWRRNLNEELTAPVMRKLVFAWARTFHADLFTSFEEKCLLEIKSILNDVETSCPEALHDKVRQQAQTCIDDARNSIHRTTDTEGTKLRESQKDVSRMLVPTIQAQLMDTYRTASEELGRGSVRRKKAIMREFFSTDRQDVFVKGTAALFQGLDDIAKEAKIALEAALHEVADKVEVNLAVLWEEDAALNDSLSVAEERFSAIANIKFILKQLLSWEGAASSMATTISEQVQVEH